MAEIWEGQQRERIEQQGECQKEEARPEICGDAVTACGDAVMGEETFEKDSGGARGLALRASFEGVLGGAAEHTSLKAKGTGTLESGEGINRVLWSMTRLAALHRLLSRGHKGTSRRRSGASGRGRNSSSGSSGIRGNSWITVRHGWTLERLESGVVGSRVVASESTTTVGPKDRHKKMELALVDKLGEGLEKGKRVNRDVIGGESHKKRSRLGKGSNKRGLRVEEFEGSKTQRGRQSRQGKDSKHAGGEDWGSSSSSSSISAKDDELELGGRKKREAVGVAVGDNISQRSGS